jgi:hypothetical protein
MVWVLDSGYGRISRYRSLTLTNKRLKLTEH